MKHNNYLYLFAGLSILLLFAPGLADYLPNFMAPVVGSAGFCAVLVFGVFTFNHRRFAFRLGISLAVGLIALSLLQHLSDSAVVLFAVLCLFLAFLSIATWMAGEDVLFSGRYDPNRIVGAICIYQLLGLIWAVLYAGIDLVSPAAFGNLSMTSNSDFKGFVYFSFVTLTTLGYGDHTPAGSLARSLAYLEALIGQLYIAIVIASMVGARLAKKSHDD